MDIRSILKQHIQIELAFDSTQKQLSDNTPLVASGILDSTNLLRLVAFIEERFGISVGDEELEFENFRDIDALAVFIGRKLSRAT